MEIENATESETGWESTLPTAGGWWKIRCDENFKYHLSFLAVMSPRPDCEYTKTTFESLSRLYSYLSKLEEENE